MHRQGLELRETVLGQEHPDAFLSMDNLGKALGHQGKYEQAEEMHRQALELQKVVLGQDHPKTLNSMGNLA
jgi:tetratricopeptide (TPR) repeat protein